jgi:tetratricopeptide (TPR) repeat protein
MTTQDQASQQPFYRDYIQQVFNRALRGEYDYGRDIDELKKHLNEAHRAALGPEIEGELINTMGAISGLAGYYEQAQAYFQQAYDLHSLHGNAKAAATAMINYALSKQTEGDYQAAEAAFLKAQRELVAHGQLPIVDGIAGLATVYYQMKRYDEIMRLYREIDAHCAIYLERHKRSYYASLSVIHELLARITLRERRPDAARDALDRAREYAGPDAQPLRLGSLQMVDAYIMYQSGDMAGALARVQAARQQVQESNALMRIARFHFKEATDAYAFGMITTAKLFSEYAILEFKKLKIKHDTERALQMLAEFGSE